MILPVPQCWASRCLNHLPALADSSVSLCDCCANHLPAQPLFSCVNSGVFLRRGAGSPSGSTWRRPCCWWGGQGRAGSIAGGWGGHSSPTPRSSPPGLCHSDSSHTRREWQSSACSVPCPRGQAVPQVLGWRGPAACFATDLAPLQVFILVVHSALLVWVGLGGGGIWDQQLLSI